MWMELNADRNRSSASSGKATKRTRSRTLAIAGATAMLIAAIAGGCAKNTSSTWAQTSPLITADATHVSSNDAVSLGTRGM